ncbi:MAG: type II toxin-antitoxin system RelE family toxin [Leptospirillum sp.]
MDSYKVVWKRSAEKELRKLPKEIIRKLLDQVSMLSRDPFPAGVKKIVNTESVFRLRAGDYRLIFRVEQSKLIIEVILVGHRRDVYR